MTTHRNKKLEKHFYWWNSLSYHYYIIHLIPLKPAYIECNLPGFEAEATINYPDWQLIDCHGGLIKVRKNPIIIKGTYEFLFSELNAINKRRIKKKGYQLVSIHKIAEIEKKYNKSILCYSEKCLLSYT